MLELSVLALAGLQAHLSICLADLKLFGPADLVLVSLDKLRLRLLMPPVLLLVVADLIVKLLQVVLESDDLVPGRTDRVVETSDVLVSLLDHLPLVPNPVLCRVNLSAHALHREL